MRMFNSWLVASLLAAWTAMAQVPFSSSAQYLIIDLSGGADASQYPVFYTNDQPNLDFSTCWSNELWLRLIPAGTFMIGSPSSELGRGGDEDLHQVTLTQPFYIGIFEVTQKQYELVMGTNPSGYKGDSRPVVNLSWNMLRGSSAGAQWPASDDVDASSFFGKLRAKTALLADLPTEAQWEYACRAGTTTALNSGKNITSKEQCPNVAEVGRYKHNRSDGKGGYKDRTTKVGMYQPNAWGLYDMHGNAWEFCLDWYAEHLGTDPMTDPKGPISGTKRAQRGGGCNNSDDALRCRSSIRSSFATPEKTGDHSGFRVAILPRAGQATAQPQSPSLTAPVDQAATPTIKGAGMEKPTGKTVKVIFKVDTRRETLQESGLVSRVRQGDEVAFSVISETDRNKVPQPDSTWIVEGIEVAETPALRARDAKLPTLKPEGRFVFLHYTVENPQQADLYSGMPVLVDSRDRRFFPVGETLGFKMASYLPEGKSWFIQDKVSPGFTKSFCAVFDIPPNSTLKHVEIFPVKGAHNFLVSIRQGKVKGKAVELITAPEGSRNR